MRKITISATAVAGVAAVALLALPISSALADDDLDVKRDEDTPSLTTVDDDDLDGNDPTGPQTNGATNTNGPTNGPTNVTNGATNDVTQNDVTKNDATQDATGASSDG